MRPRYFFGGPTGHLRRRRTAGSQPFAGSGLPAPGTVAALCAAKPGQDVRSRGAVSKGQPAKKGWPAVPPRLPERQPNLARPGGVGSLPPRHWQPRVRRRHEKRRGRPLAPEATFSHGGLFVLALGAPSRARDATQPLAARGEEIASGTPPWSADGERISAPLCAQLCYASRKSNIRQGWIPP